jgi:hypothetical protein
MNVKNSVPQQPDTPSHDDSAPLDSTMALNSDTAGQNAASDIEADGHGDSTTRSQANIGLESNDGSESGKDERGMNPQDGAIQKQNTGIDKVIVQSDMTVAVPVSLVPSAEPEGIPLSLLSNDEVEERKKRPPLEVLKEEVSLSSAAKPNRRMRSSNRRRPRVVSIGNAESLPKGLPTPTNQYECILIRRAILPLSANPLLQSTNVAELSHDKEDTDDSEAIYGDIALGMKLSIADTGHVIVQKVTSLADGRASPAQLTGMIQRGDVLLSIDGTSLAENALAGLGPLRAPEDCTVPCQRQYKLKFAAGLGLEMLQSIENRQATLASSVAGNPALEMMALFPMVDQLSGMPLFHEEIISDKENDKPIIPLPIEAPSEIVVPEKAPRRKKVDVPLDDQISDSLSNLRNTEKMQYFTKETLEDVSQKSRDASNLNLTLSQRQDLGRQGIVGAKNLLKRVEGIDAGKDLRSFQSWNTTISLYSRASTRRRRVFDAASLPLKNYGHFDEAKEESSDGGGSVKSSTNSEQLDGDELLLRLAAHDEIWRKQVLEFLETVAHETDEPGSLEDEKKLEQPVEINAAMSSELGNFLFGDSMTKILAKHKSPRTLPSEEVTAVLFDLGTKLSASIPDEIKASGTILSAKSELTPFTEMKRHAADSDVVLAARFLLDDALPAWLKSFRPLAWEHRRILWPIEKKGRVRGSSMASTLSDDSLTVDTTMTSMQSASVGRRKNIREIIEDNQLDIETRGET